MKGTFEVKAVNKDGKDIVFYLTVNLYNGVANDIVDWANCRGWTNVDVRLT